MTYNTCSKCAEKLNAEANFCPSCRQPVQKQFSSKRHPHLTDEEMAAIKLLLRKNGKLKAIKHYKTIVGCSLKEAKEQIDRMVDTSEPFHLETESSSLTGPVLLFFVILILATLLWMNMTNS